jgi:hypothetical protein
MAFNKPNQPIPVSVGRISIEIDDEAGVAADVQIRARIIVKDANGHNASGWTGNLTPHLTTAQKNGIVSLLAAMRTKAQGELI